MKNVKIISAEEILRDQRVIKEAKYISKIGYNVEILCWDREGEFKDKEIEYMSDIKIKRFFPHAIYGSGWKQILPFFKFMIEVKRYLEDQEYQYLHCQNLDGTIVGFLASSKKTLIFDMREFYEGREKNKLKKFIIRRLVNFAVEKSNYIIYVNDTQKSKIKSSNKSKLIYLPNYPQATLGESINKETSKYLNITYIGGVRQFLEFVNLFEAVKEIPDVWVSIHGMGTTYKELKEIEKNYSNIRITGGYDPSETLRLFNSTDILYCVYSTNNENWRTGYPIKLFEAIITKTPVIVNRGTVLEKFVNEHDIGFTVDGGSIDDIKKLIDCINGNRNLLQEKVKKIENIQYNYNWDEVVKNLDQVYKQS